MSITSDTSPDTKIGKVEIEHPISFAAGVEFQAGKIGHHSSINKETVLYGEVIIRSLHGDLATVSNRLR